MWKAEWRLLGYLNYSAIQLAPLEHIPEGIRVSPQQIKLHVYCCSLLNSQDMEPADEWMKKMWKGNVQRGLKNVMPLKGEK